LGLALLAAWCIGRPAGVAPATMAATALVASLPVMASSQAGTAKNDIVALALLLAAVALLVNGRGSRAALIVAALAAGLAAGTRLNLWAPAIALGAVVVIAGWNGSRRAAAGWWLVGVIAGSGLWYVRNLVETGNPLPWFGVKIAGLVTLHSTTAPADCGQASVADFASNPSFVRTHLLPQLPGALGMRWWLVLSLGAVGIGAGLLSRRTPMGRGLAAVALVSGVAYLLTPTTAGGAEARCFAFNTRFAVPALALGLIVLPLVLSRMRVHPLVGVLAFLLTVLLTGDLNRHTFFDARPMLATILLISGVTAAALLRWRALPRSVLAGALVVLVAVGGALLWREQDSYLRARYTQPQLYQPVEGVYTVLRRVSHARVALRGFSEQYPLYGLDASNRVDLPAARVEARFAPYKTCPSWLLALSTGGYNYVVTARQGERESPAAEWTRRYPGAQQVLAAGPGTERKGNQWRWQLFRLVPDRPVDLQTACHSA
jgi:hypothetical protein